VDQGFADAGPEAGTCYRVVSWRNGNSIYSIIDGRGGPIVRVLHVRYTGSHYNSIRGVGSCGFMPPQHTAAQDGADTANAITVDKPMAPTSAMDLFPDAAGK